jgi:16S rRNA (guanine966-N2)-methyltransferase
MRVITGKFRGRKLQAPPGRGVRPPLDRVKEGYFNIVQGQVAGSNFLDLFAGSGSMGIEALSREARRVVFVEKRRDAQAALERNLEHVRLLLPYDPRIRMRPMAPDVEKDAFELLPLDAKEGVSRLAVRGETFRLAFVDPPYDYPHHEALLALIAESGMLDASSLVTIHHHKKRPMPPSVSNGTLEQVRTRAYGQSVLSFYRLAAAEENFSQTPP